MIFIAIAFVNVNVESEIYNRFSLIENVLAYGNKKYTWNTGKILKNITDGENSYNYTYDENGIQTNKTINGDTTYYNISNGVILFQTVRTNTIYFQYDSNGLPITCSQGTIIPNCVGLYRQIVLNISVIKIRSA